jgi:acyl-CoA synthetase (NDP forming)
VTAALVERQAPSSAARLDEVRAILAERAPGAGASLSEHDSLRVLAAWGLETVRLHFAPSRPEALGQAKAFGFPLVLKGLVPDVAHKTERGLVHPWLRSPAELEQALAELPAACRGFLLEEQVRGIRELVLGIVRDPTFGASVLVAMGGVHSELIADTSFVLAPVDAAKARGALARLRCARMLAAYRGEAPAKLELLTAMMQQLGELALACPEIRELDINPVILRRDGTPVACSALCVL